MTRSPDTLRPVFLGLRIGLHTLVLALLAFAVWSASVHDPESVLAVVIACVVFLAVYVAGAFVFRARGTGRVAAIASWICVLTAIWAVLVWLRPEGAYLVFPLFFVYLHLLPLALGIVAVGGATVIAIVALGLHSGFTVGGVTGPLIGAAVAIFIGLGYRALALEAQEREALMAELIATRDRLIDAEHERGRLAERSRLARELHDTVAQGLSSMQMLLHAAERDLERDHGLSDGDSGIEYLRLARGTAADGLRETRQFIRELAPPGLDDGLEAALRRLAAQQEHWAQSAAEPSGAGLRIEVSVRDETELPMAVQAAFLRVAQGALSNTVRHAGARRADVTVAVLRNATSGNAPHAQLTITDDGVGFDPAALQGSHASDSAAGFGLRAIEERATQLGGSYALAAAPGRGVTITVTVPLSADLRSEPAALRSEPAPQPSNDTHEPGGDA